MKFQPLIIVVGSIYEASKDFRELNCLSIRLYSRNEIRLEILLIISWFSARASIIGAELGKRKGFNQISLAENYTVYKVN